MTARPTNTNVYINPGANIAAGMTAVQMNNQAHSLEAQGDLVGAEALHLQALAIKHQSFGVNSTQAALTHNALGEVQLKLGKLGDAEENLRQAVTIRNRDAHTSLDAAVSRENLAQVLEAKGDLVAAKEMRMTGVPKSIVCGNYNCPGQAFSLDKLSICGKCKSVFYCSKECQKIDWKARHKPLCSSG